MSETASTYEQNAWQIIGALIVVGCALLALGAGMVTEGRIPYVGNIGAFALMFAGMGIMWKSESSAG